MKNTNKTTENKTKTSIFKNRKFKYGSLAAALTVCFIAVIITANAIISSLFAKYWIYTDLTSSDLYTLSEEARELLNSDLIKNDIEIKFAIPEDSIARSNRMLMIYSCANAYAEASKDLEHKITVNCYDAYLYPSEFADYKTLAGGEWSDTNVVVESSNGTPIVYTMNSFFTTDTESGKELGFSGERRFLSAFFQLAGVEKPVVCFTTGHGEPIGTKDDQSSNEYADFFTMLGDWGFETKIVDLQREELDENCRLVIILDPKKDFVSKELDVMGARSEIDKIGEYMATEYGSMMVFTGSTGTEFPVLNEYLEEWGVKINTTEKITDHVNSISTSNTTFTVEYVDNTQTATIVEKFSDLRTAFSNAAPVEVLANNDTETMRVAVPLFVTSDTAQSVSSKETKTGRFNLFTLTKGLTYHNNEAMYNYVIACGSPEMLKYCTSQSYANREIMYMLTQRIHTVKIPFELDYKTYENNGLSLITSRGVLVWGVVLIGVLPAAVLAVGTVTVIRRKRK